MVSPRRKSDQGIGYINVGNTVWEAMSGPAQYLASPSRAAPQQLASSSRSMLSAPGIQMQYYPSTYGKPPRGAMSYYTTLAAEPMPSPPFLPTPPIPSPLSLYQRPTQFFPVHCQPQQTLALKGAQPVDVPGALMMSEQSVVHVHSEASPTECKAVKHESPITPPSCTTLTTEEADSSTASCVNASTDQGYVSHDSVSLQHEEGQEYYVQTPVTSVQVPPFPSFSHSQPNLRPPYSHGISTYAHPRPGYTTIPYPSHSAHIQTLLQIQKEEPFPRHNSCHICGKTYARQSTLKTHLRSHSGEKPYQCSICQKSFTQAANLTAHLRTHSGEKPFKCPVCNRGFSQSSSVTTHMRTHSGDRPYKCNACGKGFADSSTLTKHYRTHTGEKPYQCKICDARFSQSGNLNRHMRTHRNHFQGAQVVSRTP